MNRQTENETQAIPTGRLQSNMAW